MGFSAIVCVDMHLKKLVDDAIKVLIKETLDISFYGIVDADPSIQIDSHILRICL